MLFKKPQKILVLHNRYQQQGGEDEVFEQEIRLLRRMGHTVVEYQDSNDRLHRIGAVPALIEAIWSRDTIRRLRPMLQEIQPDIAHFHNTFAMISPAAYYACREARVPVVQTLHNYRTGCPNASCAIDGSPCQRCVAKTIAWPGIARKCYRGSRSATAGVAALTAVHKLIGTYRRKVDAYISTTEFARAIHIRSGLPQSRIFVKPNFVDPVPTPASQHQSHGYALYVGRITPEKGVDTLIEAWHKLRSPTSLILAGGGHGPAAEAVRRAQALHPSIRWIGAQPRAEIVKLMLGADFLIHPSRLYEGCGMVVVEAFSVGLPSIVSGHGSLKELVEDGSTGLHFRPGDPADLALKIDWMRTHPALRQQMAAAARAKFDEQFTPERNYGMLMQIYQSAIEHSQSFICVHPRSSAANFLFNDQ
jgi:glycosyltransferase involved in cell wall biosynthesis